MRRTCCGLWTPVELRCFRHLHFYLHQSRISDRLISSSHGAPARQSAVHHVWNSCRRRACNNDAQPRYQSSPVVFTAQAHFPSWRFFVHWVWLHLNPPSVVAMDLCIPMSLQAGDKFGPYEILAPIGAGGMGEVCRARDTKLDREVAVKVLPAALAQDRAPSQV